MRPDPDPSALAAAVGRAGAAVHALPAGRGRRAWRIEGGAPLFLKCLPAASADALQAEAEGLAMLGRVGCFRVPAVHQIGSDQGCAWLALEWMDIAPVASAADGRAFGQSLAELHAVHGDAYGLGYDNWLGDCPQPNGQARSWPMFFAGRRLSPQIERLVADGEQGMLPRTLRTIVERLPALFLDYRPAASLLHGDLWHGNCGMVGGQPAVFDPAVHYGDREADFAMAELFGGFPLDMYAAYRAVSPLDGAAPARRELYRLYYLLNHLLLFGASYRREVERTAARLLAQLS